MKLLCDRHISIGQIGGTITSRQTQLDEQYFGIYKVKSDLTARKYSRHAQDVGIVVQSKIAHRRKIPPFQVNAGVEAHPQQPETRVELARNCGCIVINKIVDLVDLYFGDKLNFLGFER